MNRLRKRFPAGAPIFREGEPGERAFLIEAGRVEITVCRGGEPLRLATLGPGEIFGEMALIDNRLRSATATPLDEIEALVIDRRTVQELLDGADPLLRLLLRVLLDRFRDTQRRLTKESATGSPYGESEDETLTSATRATAERLKLADDLSEAVDKDRFFLVYHPIVDLTTEAPAGVEALIRWDHPERGLIGPGAFMPFAEDSPAIEPIGAWVIEQASAAVSDFQNALNEAGGASDHAGRPFVSLNVAPRQLHAPGFADRLARILAASEVPPNHVKLEITERLLMSEPDQAAAILERLKEIGVRIALDDFGTGYSSLNYLHRFPIDTLKIDGSFVLRMLEDATSHSIVRAVVGLSDALGLEVIAEGVETDEQAHELRQLGCHYAQGFNYGRPMVFHEAEAMFRQRGS